MLFLATGLGYVPLFLLFPSIFQMIFLMLFVHDIFQTFSNYLVNIGQFNKLGVFITSLKISLFFDNKQEALHTNTLKIYGI